MPPKNKDKDKPVVEATVAPGAAIAPVRVPIVNGNLAVLPGATVEFDGESIVIKIDATQRLDKGNSGRIASSAGTLLLNEWVPGLRLKLKCWVEQAGLPAEVESSDA